VGTAVLFAAVLAAFFSVQHGCTITQSGHDWHLHPWIHWNHFEEVFEFNKAGVVLLMSTGLWVTYADFSIAAVWPSSTVLSQLKEQLAEVSDICFFACGLSTIVEVVDYQDSRLSQAESQYYQIRSLLDHWLSYILSFRDPEQLTVTIVVSLLHQLIPDDDDRRLFSAMVVVAANAGGVGRH
jgi:hypothetical protein